MNNLISIEELKKIRKSDEWKVLKIPVTEHHKIAQRHVVDRVSIRALAKEYGVSKSNMHRILKNFLEL